MNFLTSQSTLPPCSFFGLKMQYWEIILRNFRIIRFLGFKNVSVWIEEKKGEEGGRSDSTLSLCIQFYRNYSILTISCVGRERRDCFNYLGINYFYQNWALFLLHIEKLKKKKRKKENKYCICKRIINSFLLKVEILVPND